MIERRPYEALGTADYGWLKARYHFSFADYFNPSRMGWGKLRVWNDDLIAPQKGFPPHPHRNMEIITFIRKGAITHKDNAGHEGRTEAGNVQVMSAGTGIQHSEYNLETTETSLFQIWIETDHTSLPPAWGNKTFPEAEREGRFVVLASGFTADKEALPIHTDSRILGATLQPEQTIDYVFLPFRLGYLVVSSGEITLNGLTLKKGDGAAIKNEVKISLKAQQESEIILVDTSP